jgi:hypothetical protein
VKPIRNQNANAMKAVLTGRRSAERVRGCIGEESFKGGGPFQSWCSFLNPGVTEINR